MELQRYACKLSNTATRLIALAFFIAWYGLGIYLVVVTLAIEQFHERYRQLSELYPGGFTSLRILENRERMAIAAVEKAGNYSQQIQQSIEDIDSKITEYNQQTIKLSVAATQATNDKESKRLAAQAAEATAMSSLLKQQRGKILEPRDNAIKQLEQIQGKITESQRAALGVIRRLDAEEKLLTRYANPFFVMPREMLTLALTLSLGIFGSTITVSRAVLNATTTKSGLLWVLLRPLQGAVIALAVFILAKAGIVIFASQPSAAGSPIELNPFTIGFIGIVSGLYADRAYEYLERVSARFFQANDKLPDAISQPRSRDQLTASEPDGRDQKTTK
jgi:hypothetical protein